MSTIPPSSVGTYLYCVARARAFAPGMPPLNAEGIGGAAARPRVIYHADLAAVASDAPYLRYDISRANVLAHQAVIEEAMTRGDVLPVRFGTVADSDRDIEEYLLRRGADQLRQQLEGVSGCVEMGLKVLWNSDRLFSEIADEDAAIRAMRDAIATQEPGATHYQRLQLGEMVDEAIQWRREREAQMVLEALQPLARESSVNRLLTDMMVVNAAFLVERGALAAFDAEVSALMAAQAGRLTCKYAGPLPPYSFVSLVFSGEEETRGIAH